MPCDPDEPFDEADLITCDGCGDSHYRLITFNCSKCGADVCEICHDTCTCEDAYEDFDGILEEDTH